MPFAATRMVEPLEVRQLFSSPVGPSPLTVSAGVTPSEISSRVFNVCSYGAKVDARADDTASIQAAIDAMERMGGGTLVLPAGTYRISKTIQIENASKFIVSATGAILKPFSSMSPNDDSGDLLRITSCSSFTINGLKIDGYRRGRGSGFPGLSMRMNGCSDFRINACAFINSTLDDLYLDGDKSGRSTRDGVIQDCTFDGAYRNGITVVQANHIEITRNSVSHVVGMHPNTGIVIEAGPDSPMYSSSDILINQNTITDIAESGIAVAPAQAPKRITIDSNSFVNCPAGVLIRGDECVITNNYFVDGARSASGPGSSVLGQISVMNYAGTSVVISDNTISDVTGMSGIYIHSTWSGVATVTGNTVQDVSGVYCGIAIWSNNAHILSNRLDDIEYIGIGVTANYAEIGMNWLSNGSSSAIYYAGNGGLVYQNTVEDFGAPNKGVCISTTGGTIGCNIFGNTIYCTTGATNWIGIRKDALDNLDPSNKLYGVK